MYKLEKQNQQKESQLATLQQQYAILERNNQEFVSQFEKIDIDIATRIAREKLLTNQVEQLKKEKTALIVQIE